MREPTKQQMLDALNALRMARKESTQAFSRISYSDKVQPLFDMLDETDAVRTEYESYFDDCERANRIPLSYEQWLEQKEY